MLAFTFSVLAFVSSRIQIPSLVPLPRQSSFPAFFSPRFPFQRSAQRPGLLRFLLVHPILLGRVSVPSFSAISLSRHLTGAEGVASFLSPGPPPVLEDLPRCFPFLQTGAWLRPLLQNPFLKEVRFCSNPPPPRTCLRAEESHPPNPVPSLSYFPPLRTENDNPIFSACSVLSVRYCTTPPY